MGKLKHREVNMDRWRDVFREGKRFAQGHSQQAELHRGPEPRLHHSHKFLSCEIQREPCLVRAQRDPPGLRVINPRKSVVLCFPQYNRDHCVCSFSIAVVTKHKGIGSRQVNSRDSWSDSAQPWKGKGRLPQRCP